MVKLQSRINPRANKDDDDDEDDNASRGGGRQVDLTSRFNSTHCSLIVIITDGEREPVIAAAAEEPEIGKGGIARWMCDKKRTNFHLGTAVAS